MNIDRCALLFCCDFCCWRSEEFVETMRKIEKLRYKQKWWSPIRHTYEKGMRSYHLFIKHHTFFSSFFFFNSAQPTSFVHLYLHHHPCHLCIWISISYLNREYGEKERENIFFLKNVQLFCFIYLFIYFENLFHPKKLLIFENDFFFLQNSFFVDWILSSPNIHIFNYILLFFPFFFKQNVIGNKSSRFGSSQITGTISSVYSINTGGCTLPPELPISNCWET